MEMAVNIIPWRARRLDEGLTLEQMAAKAGLTATTLRYVEYGWLGFTPETGERLAQAYGFTDLAEVVP